METLTAYVRGHATRWVQKEIGWEEVMVEASQEYAEFKPKADIQAICTVFRHITNLISNDERACLEDEEWPRLDLAETDLRKVNLSEADLSKANLGGADLRGARLDHACLEYANLLYARLNDADLEGAILYCARLACADLSNAYLKDADLRGANLEQAKIKCFNTRCTKLGLWTVWLPLAMWLHFTYRASGSLCLTQLSKASAVRKTLSPLRSSTLNSFLWRSTSFSLK